MTEANLKIIRCNSQAETASAVSREIHDHMDGERGFNMDFHPQKEINGRHMECFTITSIVCNEEQATIIIGDYKGELDEVSLLKLNIKETDE